MEFGWINVFGAVFVILLLIPNIAYAVRNRGEENLSRNRFMNALEQIGRYACIALMWLPFPVGKFGFARVFEMMLCLAGNAVLTVVYWILFARYAKTKSAVLARILALLPACVFLLSGLLLRHWLLAGAAVLFGIGHLYVTAKNHAR
ncbi:MAG: hypothetical protein J6Q17_08785 [Clostridia bacterium]|nr:hypothetical protein [Clostridia bacterium]